MDLIASRQMHPSVSWITLLASNLNLDSITPNSNSEVGHPLHDFSVRMPYFLLIKFSPSLIWMLWERKSTQALMSGPVGLVSIGCGLDQLLTSFSYPVSSFY
ncbi:unnamed protein product [Protopolystoma xenopodis]|uniref:Uncharacterized protein n=1 Tax=Protopolystoma xenopodis TaxID=117903 RepID=A0A3S5AGB8_9PLAT|nr:unnamed protein product [Protopolystoma xenopodis]